MTGCVIFLAIAIALAVFGFWASNKAAALQDQLKQIAIAEGTKAGEEEGTTERDCPYSDGTDEPRKRTPPGLNAVFGDPQGRSQHYWWIFGYRSAYERTFANPESSEFRAGWKVGKEGGRSDQCPWSPKSEVKDERISAANWLSGYRKAIEVIARKEALTGRNAVTPHLNQSESDQWFAQAIETMVSIYIDHPNHGDQGPESERELQRIGEMLNDRGGIQLMRAAHVEFTRLCTFRNVRDKAGYISAPRSLEHRWSGIGTWQG